MCRVYISRLRRTAIEGWEQTSHIVRTYLITTVSYLIPRTTLGRPWAYQPYHLFDHKLPPPYTVDQPAVSAILVHDYRPPTKASKVIDPSSCHQMIAWLQINESTRSRIHQHGRHSPAPCLWLIKIGGHTSIGRTNRYV